MCVSHGRPQGQERKNYLKNYMENTKWVKININISQQFLLLEQVTTLGIGIGAIRDLVRNCQWPCSLAQSSGRSPFRGGHLECRGRTYVYHSSLILSRSSPCAVCWRTFPLDMMLQAEDSIAHSREHIYICISFGCSAKMYKYGMLFSPSGFPEIWSRNPCTEHRCYGDSTPQWSFLHSAGGCGARIAEA